jgi:hypothetical protein
MTNNTLGLYTLELGGFDILANMTMSDPWTKQGFLMLHLDLDLTEYSRASTELCLGRALMHESAG